jgi:hypothetical protein
VTVQSSFQRLERIVSAAVHPGVRRAWTRPMNPGRSMGRLWRILKAAASGFLANDALSRGAAIAFDAATSLAPVLLIVVAVAGLVFGQDAARGAISEELGQLLGPLWRVHQIYPGTIPRSGFGNHRDAFRRRDGSDYRFRRVRRDAHGSNCDVQSQAERRADLSPDPDPCRQPGPGRGARLHAGGVVGPQAPPFPHSLTLFRDCSPARSCWRSSTP